MAEYKNQGGIPSPNLNLTDYPVSLQPGTVRWTNGPSHPDMFQVVPGTIPLARPTWDLKPTEGSPRAHVANWSKISESHNDFSEPASNGFFRPTSLPSRNLPPLRTSRKAPIKSALKPSLQSHILFNPFPMPITAEGKKEKARNGLQLKRTEANILADEQERLRDPEAFSQRPNRVRAHQGFNPAQFTRPANGVLPDIYNDAPNNLFTYPLNLTKQGFPLRAEYYTPETWKQWKKTHPEYRYNRPANTPVPAKDPGTPGRRHENTPKRRINTTKNVGASKNGANSYRNYSSDNSKTPKPSFGGRKTRKHKIRRRGSRKRI